MTFKAFAFGCLLAGLAGAGWAEITPKKKLIEFGWDMPSPEQLRDNLAAYEALPFDGIGVKLPMGQAIFTKDPYPEDEYQAQRDILSGIKFTNLTDNFLVMWGTAEDGWLWTNDTDWQSAETNIRNFARTAAAGGFKGILWDAETYGYSPWVYSAERYPDQNFDAVQKVVFNRGAQFVTAIQAEMPDVQILALWLIGSVLDQRQWNVYPSTGNYALYGAFISGMYTAVDGRARLIDGNESSYYYLGATDFEGAGAYLKTGIPLLLPAAQTAAATKFNLGQAVYADGVLNLWKSTRFIGYYMADDTDRMNLYKYNLYNGLRTADEYLWLYNENMNWATGDVPAGLLAATREVKALINAGKPLGIDMDASIARARIEFDRKVEFWGRISDEADAPIAGASVLSGISADDGSESGCGIYNVNEFGCTVPFGWDGTLTPVLEGYRFEPATIVIKNAAKAEGLRFTAIRQ